MPKKHRIKSSFPENVHDLWISEEKGAVNSTTALLTTLVAIVVLSALWMQKFVYAPAPLPIVSSAPCSQDAKQCPNGSYVSRIGPHCEFGSCSETTPVPSVSASPVQVH